MAELEEKSALVTGAGVGIGRAIALTMADQGARVVVADLNEETAQETATLIREAGGDAHTFVADVSDEQRVSAMVEFTVKTFGSLDVACNSAAVSRGSGPIHTFDKAVFDQTLDLCLTNTFLCMKYEIEAMLEQTSGGSIVNISSNASLRGQPYNTAYAAAKSGVNLLTKSAAAEYGHKGIRINAVSPGVIRTPGVE
ncbi:SDR family oxidoreductase, partial [Luminiphilus sp.]|nr:SDR family oxidoreductase [Luminiphilus sp.]